MDDRIRAAERTYLSSGNRDDIVAYINLIWRSFGKCIESSKKEKCPKVYGNGKRILRQADQRNADWELGHGKRHKAAVAKVVDNYAFYDALEITPTMARTFNYSPFIEATSIVDGTKYPITPSYILKLLPYFRNGILVGKFTFTNANGVTSLILEKE